LSTFWAFSFYGRASFSILFTFARSLSVWDVQTLAQLTGLVSVVLVFAVLFLAFAKIIIWTFASSPFVSAAQAQQLVAEASGHVTLNLKYGMHSQTFSLTHTPPYFSLVPSQLFDV